LAEFLTLIPPDQAREQLLAGIEPLRETEKVGLMDSLGRVAAEDIHALHSVPHFPRSTVDGYAVRARDTYGASESIPAYLKLIGEVAMGSSPTMSLGTGQTSLIHTGGMLPEGCDAVVMLENVQVVGGNEIEVGRAVAVGENTITVGEDVAKGQLVIPKGTTIRPSEIGGLAALGIVDVRIVRRPRIGVISTGDEVIAPEEDLRPGRVRDINTYSLSALIQSAGAMPVSYGIIPDEFEQLLDVSRQALEQCDAVLITAGSSASSRDQTALVINTLGKPGVLVHGINTRPGKPTIIGRCNGKPVLGLPGNPVSALVNGMLFVVPLIKRLHGDQSVLPTPTVKAELTINLASQAGREDWQPVRLRKEESRWLAEPVFGKSNLIFSLSFANGLVCIAADQTGLSSGETVDVYLF